MSASRSASAPTIDVFLCQLNQRSAREVRFWCSHCDAWHRHGEDAIGVRLPALCTNPRSPHMATGYVLRLRRSV